MKPSTNELSCFTRVATFENKSGLAEPRLVTLLSIGDIAILLEAFIKNAKDNKEVIADELDAVVDVLKEAQLKTMASMSVLPKRTIKAEDGSDKLYKTTKGASYKGTFSRVSFFNTTK